MRGRTQYNHENSGVLCDNCPELVPTRGGSFCNYFRRHYPEGTVCGRTGNYTEDGTKS